MKFQCEGSYNENAAGNPHKRDREPDLVLLQQLLLELLEDLKAVVEILADGAWTFGVEEPVKLLQGALEVGDLLNSDLGEPPLDSVESDVRVLGRG